MSEQNAIMDFLIDLRICDVNSIEEYFPSVRDREDVGVLKCQKSGVIFLNRSDHIDLEHYIDSAGFSYWSDGDRKSAVNGAIEDRNRRVKLLSNIVANKKWMDVGTGAGGILDELQPITKDLVAVEPQQEARAYLADMGYKAYQNVGEVNEHDIDVVTLFHVFEHFIDPLVELQRIHDKMTKGGRIYIEVPHARDFLISFLEHEQFKKFTFWSEHLILHTRASIKAFLHAAGFNNIVVQGCQRYPLANHLHWLVKNSPGGHENWSFLRTNELDAEYERMLINNDMTDTLIVTGFK